MATDGAADLVGPGDPDFPLDMGPPGRPWFVLAVGRKGSGKSAFNREVYRSYPGDKLCIDVNGNAEPGEDAERLTGDLPRRWPQQTLHLGEQRRPRNLHYRAHPMAKTYRDDLDRALGIALFPQDHPVLLWAGEVGELQPNGNAGPHMRVLLQQNRHYNVACLFDCPRPVYINPLTVAQSDLIAVFPLPNPNDRKRIADEAGIPFRDFDRECQATWRRGPHHFVLWDANRQTLWRCPPLPIADPRAGRPDRDDDSDGAAGAA
jgi:hypothetical protein